MKKGFVPDNDYRNFLSHKVSGLEQKVAGGNFVWKDGQIVGRHRGYPFYTVGQRKGLGIALGKPVFVIEIIPETNTVMLGDEEDLGQPEMTVGKLNMMKYDFIEPGFCADTKVRYKSPGSPSILFPEAGKIRVKFMGDEKSIAPGQSAVFYEGDDVIGGGIIEQGARNL